MSWQALGLMGFLLVAAGCAYFTQPVVLRHPQTGHTVQCGPYRYEAPSELLAVTLEEARCVDDYKRQGYQQVR